MLERNLFLLILVFEIAEIAKFEYKKCVKIKKKERNSLGKERNVEFFLCVFFCRKVFKSGGKSRFYLYSDQNTERGAIAPLPPPPHTGWPMY